MNLPTRDEARDGINEGTIARFQSKTGFAVAIVVGFTRNYKPRVRVWRRGSTGTWTQPRVVERHQLGPIQREIIEGTGHWWWEKQTLNAGIHALREMPDLGVAAQWWSLLTRS